ncbi:hypothetical protein SARC_03781 [Sphaeroforma arctica JP610]|uniref:Uncharacterized protein n=1 Tax=Sphaeroforma arctica JP610 TaxID=667725 RepID=A0A0L0G6Y8_9EUKA|nr:hypothetical protein SARC_03781 [Sphaeroforma arctica JP610]KNC83993.1 hypothetical protein SARC_03781 [Sphaeroforma arctica JP610]|eukprot:XP_014157895.1 hypothetical protein SARC_03781 [Sphaeroforma arctica JP610]
MFAGVALPTFAATVPSTVYAGLKLPTVYAGLKLPTVFAGLGLPTASTTVPATMSVDVALPIVAATVPSIVYANSKLPTYRHSPQWCRRPAMLHRAQRAVPGGPCEAEQLGATRRCTRTATSTTGCMPRNADSVHMSRLADSLYNGTGNNACRRRTADSRRNGAIDSVPNLKIADSVCCTEINERFPEGHARLSLPSRFASPVINFGHKFPEDTNIHRGVCSVQTASAVNRWVAWVSKCIL